MRKLSILFLSILSTGCATIPQNNDDVRSVQGHAKQEIANYDTMKVVLGTVALIAIAGALGKENQKSKCQNNRAGFWQGTDGRIYTCP